MLFLRPKKVSMAMAVNLKLAFLRSHKFVIVTVSPRISFRLYEIVLFIIIFGNVRVGAIFEFVASRAMLKSFSWPALGASVRMVQWLDGACDP